MRSESRCLVTALKTMSRRTSNQLFFSRRADIFNVMVMNEDWEYPEVVTDTYQVTNEFNYSVFGGNLIHGGYYNPDIYGKSYISIFSELSPLMTPDVVDEQMENIIRVIDHESMHWILFMLEGQFATSGYDSSLQHFWNTTISELVEWWIAGKLTFITAIFEGIEKSED